MHDIGIVSLGGVRVGAFDRRSRTFALGLPSRANPTVLEILVEAMGRVNFGQEIHDSKGLHGPVFLGDSELTGWEMFLLPLDAEQLEHLAYASLPEKHGPGFFHFDIELKETGDTFLDCVRSVKAWSGSMDITLDASGISARSKHCLCLVPGCTRAATSSWCLISWVTMALPNWRVGKTGRGSAPPGTGYPFRHRTLARVRVPGASVVEGSFPQGGNVQEIHFPQNIRVVILL